MFTTTCLTLLASSFASASDNLRVSGFGNVSLIKSGTENLGYKYDLTKEALYDEWSLKPGSSFGLQLNAEINDELDAVVQVVAQDRLNNDLNKSISWAFVRYRPTHNITIRAVASRHLFTCFPSTVMLDLLTFGQSQ
nr:hypothetical protein [Enterovibrio nigricans]